MSTHHSELPPSETRYDDLIGVVAVNFKENEDFGTFANSVIGYDPERYTPVALRVFAHEHEPVVTLYAIDKSERGLNLLGKKPKVKKFKIEMSFNEVLKKFKYFKFTLTPKDYNLEDMDVTE